MQRPSPCGQQVALHEGSTKEVTFRVWKLHWRSPYGRAYYEENYAEYKITFKRLPIPFSVSGITSTTYDENGTSAVATYTFTLEGGTSTAWSLSGDDAGDFSLSDADDPVLSFKSSPNYEIPRDANEDNVYEVTIEVTFGIDLSREIR